MIRDGKLFGKINVIDFLIILILVVAAALLGARMLGLTGSGGQADIGTESKVKLTFFVDSAPIVVQDKAEPGQSVRDYDTKNDLGKLISYETEDRIRYEYDGVSGQVVAVPEVYLCELTFSSEATGVYSDTGFTVNGTTYSIGGTYTICVGRVRVSCRLADMEQVG